jgi:hypothetical protein
MRPPFRADRMGSTTPFHKILNGDSEGSVRSDTVRTTACAKQEVLRINQAPLYQILRTSRQGGMPLPRISPSDRTRGSWDEDPASRCECYTREPYLDSCGAAAAAAAAMLPCCVTRGIGDLDLRRIRGEVGVACQAQVWGSCRCQARVRIGTDTTLSTWFICDRKWKLGRACRVMIMLTAFYFRFKTG